MIDSKSLFDTTYDLIGEIAKIQMQLNLVSDRIKTMENDVIREIQGKIEQELKSIHEEQQDIIKNQSTKLVGIIEEQNKSSSKIQSLETKNNKRESTIRDLDGS